MSDVERITALETWKDGHEDRCRERYERIASDTGEIKAAILAIGIKMETAVTRIHTKLETQNSENDKTHALAIKAALWLALIVLGYALSHWGPLK